jgi:hypothetical protein
VDLIDLAPPNRQLDALERWLGQPPTDLQKSIFTPAIIEIGLLNGTHVIAAMTDNTKGSQWVPYEYGRVNEATLFATNAASWWDTTTLNIDELPEYLHLAPVLKKENEIRGWLGGQMTQMKKKSAPPLSRYAASRLAAGHPAARTAADRLTSARKSVTKDRRDGDSSVNGRGPCPIRVPSARLASSC